MPEFRRVFIPGGTYFFTVVTADRTPIFRSEAACSLLGDCLRVVRQARPFQVVAIVLLPDHLHMIWDLPAGDADFSTRMSSIKTRFTREWLSRAAGGENRRPEAQARQRRRGIWQPRFMEHAIRDDDLIHYIDYIHYNPVKHGWARCPADWPYSSFPRYVRLGEYPADWACSQNGTAPTFGRVQETLIE